MEMRDESMEKTTKATLVRAEVSREGMEILVAVEMVVAKKATAEVSGRVAH